MGKGFPGRLSVSRPSPVDFRAEGRPCSPVTADPAFPKPQPVRSLLPPPTSDLRPVPPLKTLVRLPRSLTLLPAAHVFRADSGTARPVTLPSEPRLPARTTPGPVSHRTPARPGQHCSPGSAGQLLTPRALRPQRPPARCAHHDPQPCPALTGPPALEPSPRHPLQISQVCSGGAHARGAL